MWKLTKLGANSKRSHHAARTVRVFDQMSWLTVPGSAPCSAALRMRLTIMYVVSQVAGHSR